MNLDDTIVAIATPPGRGGIGVVRLAGPQARVIAAPMLRLTHDLKPGCAIFGELIEPRMGRAGAPAREIAETVSDSEGLPEELQAGEQARPENTSLIW